jgi:hypothetical protein
MSRMSVSVLFSVIFISVVYHFNIVAYIILRGRARGATPTVFACIGG